MKYHLFVSVHFLPSLVPSGALRGGIAVVVDVLRATTTMVHALASGAESVRPCLEIEGARRLAAELPRARRLLVGERDGLPIEGFDLGNSPGDFTPGACRDKTVVMTTTNGTRALLASLEAERVVLGAFVNLEATARLLKEDGRPIHVVCAGTDGQISLEDTLFAGALIAALGGRFDLAANDGALIAGMAWYDISRSGGCESGMLVADLRIGRGGRRLRELGYDADIDDAARGDRFDFAAELLRDPLRVVAARHPRPDTPDPTPNS